MMTIWAWSQPLICPVIYHNLEFIFRIFNDSISFGANSRFKTFQFAKGYVWVWLCGSCRCANFIHPRPRLRHTAVDARPTGAVGDLAANQLRFLSFFPFYYYDTHLDINIYLTLGFCSHVSQKGVSASGLELKWPQHSLPHSLSLL